MEEEEALVVLLKAGDAYAFTRLYETYVHKIYSFSLKMVKSPQLAQDITHDVFVKIWENAHNLDPNRSFQSYLFTIARNQLLNLIKRAGLERSIREEIFNKAVPFQNNTEGALAFKESKKMLHAAVEALPPQRKRIFELCRNQELSYKQVAEELNISTSTVNSQMVKALKSIKDFMLLNGTISILLFFVFSK